MKDYIRRAVKFILYIIAIFVVFLVVLPLIIDGTPMSQSFSEMLNDQRFMILMVLLLAYGFVYPLIAFNKIQRHLNGTFAENRQIFEKAFESLNYLKTEESPDKTVYRKKSQFARFSQWYEDSIVIDTNANPVTMSGMRRSLTRVDRAIDLLLTKFSE